MAEGRPLIELLAEADLHRRICRQMCIDDGIEPDENMGLSPPYHRLHNWEYHVANVNAVLRAMKTIAS